MPRPSRDDLDRRIMGLWQAGLRSMREMGLQMGLSHLDVKSRITRMIGSGLWPSDPSTKAGRGDNPSRRVLARAAAPLRPPVPVAMGPARMVALHLHITAELHTRLRIHCRETGTTVSETITNALSGLFRGERAIPR